MSGEQLGHAMAERVAQACPRGAGLEVAHVVRHERCARREDGQVKPALPHQPQLVGGDRLAQFVVADVEIVRRRAEPRRGQVGHLLLAPVFQRLGRGGEMAVTVDDHEFTGWGSR
jgi:hypothetical protein